jgi:hypothetical protein
VVVFSALLGSLGGDEVHKTVKFDRQERQGRKDLMSRLLSRPSAELGNIRGAARGISSWRLGGSKKMGSIHPLSSISAV